MRFMRGQVYLSVIFIGIFILIAVGSVIFLYKQNQQLKRLLSEVKPTPSPTVTSTPNTTPLPTSAATESASICTQEAKICPDGSSVGRTGPKCEFAPCPVVPGITNIKSGQKVVSPLTIKGVVPAGWMFEGVFPVKILDSNGALIKMGQAKEDTPGSWQSGKSVTFTSQITFEKVGSGSGIIRLENDNPSGIPSNSRKFDLPVSF